MTLTITRTQIKDEARIMHAAGWRPWEAVAQWPEETSALEQHLTAEDFWQELTGSAWGPKEYMEELTDALQDVHADYIRELADKMDPDEPGSEYVLIERPENEEPKELMRGTEAEIATWIYAQWNDLTGWILENDPHSVLHGEALELLVTGDLRSALDKLDHSWWSLELQTPEA